MTELRRRIHVEWVSVSPDYDAAKDALRSFMSLHGMAVLNLGRLLRAYHAMLRRAWPREIAAERFREALAEEGLHVRTAERWMQRAARIDGVVTERVAKAPPRSRIHSDTVHPATRLATEDRKLVGMVSTTCESDVAVDIDARAGDSDQPEPGSETAQDTRSDPRPALGAVGGSQLVLDFDAAAELAVERLLHSVQAARNGAADASLVADRLRMIADQLAEFCT